MTDINVEIKNIADSYEEIKHPITGNIKVYATEQISYNESQQTVFNNIWFFFVFFYKDSASSYPCSFAFKVFQYRKKTCWHIHYGLVHCWTKNITNYQLTSQNTINIRFNHLDATIQI